MQKVKKMFITCLLAVILISGFSFNFFNNSKDISSVLALSGSGTSSSPYIITNENEFSTMVESINKGNSDYYSVMCDIDMTKVGSEGQQISTNNATINFNHYKITNLSNPLIQHNKGSVSNLLVENPLATTRYSQIVFSEDNYPNYMPDNYNGHKSTYTFMGAICNINEGEIFGCGVWGVIKNNIKGGTIRLNNISSSSIAVGGIAGVQIGDGSCIADCYVYNVGQISSSISSTNTNNYLSISGGIVGLFLDGEIDECISAGNSISSTKMTDVYGGNIDIGGYLSGGIFGLCPIDAVQAFANIYKGPLHNSMIMQDTVTISKCFSDFKGIQEGGKSKHFIYINYNTPLVAEYQYDFTIGVSLSNSVEQSGIRLLSSNILKTYGHNETKFSYLEYSNLEKSLISSSDFVLNPSVGWIDDDDDHGTYTIGSTTYNYPYFEHNTEVYEPEEPEQTYTINFNYNKINDINSDQLKDLPKVNLSNSKDGTIGTNYSCPIETKLTLTKLELQFSLNIQKLSANDYFVFWILSSSRGVIRSSLSGVTDKDDIGLSDLEEIQYDNTKTNAIDFTDCTGTEYDLDFYIAPRIKLGLEHQGGSGGIAEYEYLYIVPDFGRVGTLMFNDSYSDYFGGIPEKLKSGQNLTFLGYFSSTETGATQYIDNVTNATNELYDAIEGITWYNATPITAYAQWSEKPVCMLNVNFYDTSGYKIKSGETWLYYYKDEKTKTNSGHNLYYGAGSKTFKLGVSTEDFDKDGYKYSFTGTDNIKYEEEDIFKKFFLVYDESILEYKVIASGFGSYTESYKVEIKLFFNKEKIEEPEPEEPEPEEPEPEEPEPEEPDPEDITVSVKYILNYTAQRGTTNKEVTITKNKSWNKEEDGFYFIPKKPTDFGFDSGDELVSIKITSIDDEDNFKLWNSDDFDMSTIDLDMDIFDDLTKSKELTVTANVIIIFKGPYTVTVNYNLNYDIYLEDDSYYGSDNDFDTLKWESEDSYCNYTVSDLGYSIDRMSTSITSVYSGSYEDYFSVVSGDTITMSKSIFDGLSADETITVCATVTLYLTLYTDYSATENRDIYLSVVFWKGYVNEGSISSLPSITATTAGMYSSTYDAYAKKINISATLYGTETYIRQGYDTYTISFTATQWMINCNTDVLDSMASTAISNSTKPNGYEYNSNTWAYGIDQTSITLNSYTTDEDIKSGIDRGELTIYQDWQYATYTITLEKNAYTNWGTQSYTAGEDVSISRTTDGIYSIIGWSIVSVSRANDDSVNISTTDGYFSSTNYETTFNFREKLFENYIYNHSDLMYGNFTIQPIYNDTVKKDLTLNFGITGTQYKTGHSDMLLYGDKDTTVTGTDTVTYTIKDVGLNDTLNLQSILRSDYTDPNKPNFKFYQDGSVKYYLVGWTGVLTTYGVDDEIINNYYAYNTTAMPGNVVTDHGGEIYAVWAVLYEVRVSLANSAYNSSSDPDVYNSLYKEGTLIQDGNLLKTGERWQDSYGDDEYYYTFYWGEKLDLTLENLYFDLNTAIGKLPSTGYSITFKNNKSIKKLNDISLKSLKSFKVNGTEKNYAITGNLNYLDLQEVLNDNKGIKNIITVEPVWEDLQFKVKVTPKAETGQTLSSNLIEQTFTINAKGIFKIWPNDANMGASTYGYWYFNYLMQGASNQFVHKIDGVETYLPVGKDFYAIALKYESETVKNVYANSIKKIDDKLYIQFDFDAYFTGAVYALQIKHLNGTSSSEFTPEILPSGNIINWVKDAVAEYSDIEADKFEYKTKFNTNGTEISAKSLYSSTNLVTVLPKYSYTGNNCFDNSVAYEYYQYKVVYFNNNYYLVLPDKLDRLDEEQMKPESADPKTNCNLTTAVYSLDFYDYASSTNYTNGNHNAYSISDISLEKDGENYKFKDDSVFNDYSSIYNLSYNWVYNGTFKLYARWLRKTYNLDLKVKEGEADSDHGYFVTKVAYKEGATNVVDYYITLYSKISNKYEVYKSTKTNFDNYPYYYTGLNSSGRSRSIETDYIEVPAGSIVTVLTYDQGADANHLNMFGYRFSSVTITNPYPVASKYEVSYNRDDSTENNDIYFVGGTDVYSTSGTNKHISFATKFAEISKFTYSGCATTFNFDILELNEYYNKNDVITLVGSLEKIEYKLSGEVDSSLGSLSYTINSNEKTGYGVQNFEEAGIKIGDKICLWYNCNFGYELTAWNFAGQGDRSKRETTQLIWNMDETATNYQIIDANFLQEFVYKNAVPITAEKEQVLGKVTPEINLIEFKINAYIYNYNTDLLANFEVTNSSFLTVKDNETSEKVSKLVFNGNYSFILDYKTNSNYTYYEKDSIHYAITNIYLANKNGREYLNLSYDFPVMSLESLDANFKDSNFQELINYVAGYPVLDSNRFVNVVIMVSPIITVESVDNSKLQLIESEYDALKGERNLYVNNALIASASIDGEHVEKTDIAYCYISQKINIRINDLASYFYSGADIYKDEDVWFTLGSGKSREVHVTEDMVLNISFIPKTLDFTFSYVYAETYYDIGEYSLIVNLSGTQILDSPAEIEIKDSTKTVTRTTKFFYSDLLTLKFDDINFNASLKVDGELPFYYRVMINGREYNKAQYKEFILTEDIGIEIQIIDKIDAVIVQTNLNNSGEINAVSTSGLSGKIENFQVIFALISGDNLHITINEATGYRFVSVTFNPTSTTTLKESIPGLIEADGVITFNLITNYDTTMSGVWILNFEYIALNIDIIYDVEGVVDNNAGSGFEAYSNTKAVVVNSCTIDDSITIRHSSSLGVIQNAGYKFIGYTISKSFYEGETVLKGGYQVCVNLKDYAANIENAGNKLIVYINYVNLYTISVTTKGVDYAQTNWEVYENETLILKAVSLKDLPKVKENLLSSIYTKNSYTIKVNNLANINKYYSKLYLNGEEIGVDKYLDIVESHNGNASSFSYKFELTNINAKTYNFEIEYKPEVLSIGIDEYTLDTIEDWENYAKKEILTTGVRKEVTITDVVNKNNLSSSHTVTLISSQTNLETCYKISHTLTINIATDVDYSICEIWINGNRIMQSVSDLKVDISTTDISFTEDSVIKIIYRKVCDVVAISQ